MISGLGKSSKICAVNLASEIGIGSNNLFFSIKERSFSKISLNDMIIKAAGQALLNNPNCNVIWGDDCILKAKVSDIGQEGNDSAIQGMRVQVKKTNHQKCVRCWHSRPEVGTIKGHESICQRCYDNVKGNGEIRIFA